ncbi:MAG: hypothetical protein JW889_11685 [Verrucomicrobia bacterium]|nr:hypothetical protein [Verrucomicrobiota bacterium]
MLVGAAVAATAGARGASYVCDDLEDLYGLGGQWEELHVNQLALAEESPVEAVQLGLELYLEKRVPEERSLVQVMANDPVIGTIILVGAKAVPVLSTTAADVEADEELRMAALFCLGRIGGNDALKAAKALRNDPVWRVRNRCVLALYDMGQGDDLVPMLKDEHWNVRALAVRALGAMGRVNDIVAFLKTDTKLANETGRNYVNYDTDVVVRWIAGYELQERLLVTERLVQSFLEARGAAKVQWANVLGALWHDAARAALERGLQDEDHAVRLACVDNLYKMGRYDTLIAHAMRHDNADVRTRAAGFVGSSGDPLLIERIVSLLDDPDAEVARDAARVIKRLKHYGAVVEIDKDSDLAASEKEWWEANKEKLATKDLAEIGLITKPDLPDIDLCTIGRTPRYDYDAEKNNPAPGDQVTFTATIKNAGTKPTGSFSYQWFIDDQPAGKGKAKSLKPGETTTVDQKWTWQAGGHWVKCVLDAENAIAEISEANNSIENKTNAFIASLWVEKTRYGIYNDEQYHLNIGSNSWEDWAQRQMRTWSFGMRRSIWLHTPEGVVDQVRLDKVVIVDDGALPLGGQGPPGNYPDLTDKTCDVEWGFDTSKLDNDHFYNTNYQMFAYLEGSLPHEMSHARYLIDLYGMGIRGGDIEVADSFGRRDYDRFADIVHDAGGGVMMGSSYFWGYSAHSACALNRRLNVRAEKGNVNASPDLGQYLSDLPAKSTFTVTNMNGQPVPNAVVLVYRSVANPHELYGKLIDDEPDLAFTVNDKGSFTVDGSLFSGKRISGYLGNTMVLFKVKLPTGDQNFIMDVTQFNLAYWNGGQAEASFTIPVNLSDNDARPSNVRIEKADGDRTMLRWEPPQPIRINTPQGSRTLEPPTIAYYTVSWRPRGQQWVLIKETIDTEFPIFWPWNPDAEYAVAAVTRAVRQSRRVPVSRPYPVNAISMFAGIDDTLYLLEPGRIVTTSLDNMKLGERRDASPGATTMAPGPDGSIYVAGATWDEQDGQSPAVRKTGILVFGRDGRIKARYGVSPDDKLALKQPRGMAVAADGRMIVADSGNNRVLLYGPDGVFDRELPNQGFAEIPTPVGIALDLDDNIYVAYDYAAQPETARGFVAVFDKDGVLLDKRIEDLSKPVGLTVSPDGRVIVAEAGADVAEAGADVAEAGAGRIRIFAPNEDKGGFEVVREITRYAGEPLGTPRAVALDRFMRIIVARDGGRLPAVLVPPTDYMVEIECEPGVFRKFAPSQCRIFITRLAEGRVRCSRVTSRIGEGGMARQEALDKSGAFSLSQGETRRLDALIGFPWEERRGILPAAFRLETDDGPRFAYTSIEMHDLLEHRLVVEKMAVNERDRWEQHKGFLVATSYAPGGANVTFKVTAAPHTAGIVTRSSTEPFTLHGMRTTLLPFEVLVPRESTGLRAQVVCTLDYVGNPYVSFFDIVRPIPWRMMGPFDNAGNAGFSTAYPPEQSVKMQQVVKTADGRELRWTAVPDELYDEENGVFFHEAIDDPEWKTIYVTTIISSPEQRDMLMHIGSDDGVVVWLNGKEVHRHDVQRGAEPDQDQVKATFLKGNNRVLIKICNGVGGWGFYFDITDPEGKPYYDLRSSADIDWNVEDVPTQ